MNTSTKGSIGRLASRLMRRAQVGHARPILPRKQSNAESSAQCMRELARKLRFQPQTRLEVFPRRNGGLYNVVWPWVASQDCVVGPRVPGLGVRGMMRVRNMGGLLGRFVRGVAAPARKMQISGFTWLAHVFHGRARGRKECWEYETWGG